MNRKKISYILMAPTLSIILGYILYNILIDIYTILVELKNMVIDNLYTDNILNIDHLVSIILVLLFVVGVIIFPFNHTEGHK